MIYKEESLLSNDSYIKVPSFITLSKKCNMITLILNLKFDLLWIYNINKPFKFSSIIYSANIIN